MTKGEALQAFFAGFGIPAYAATEVPKDAAAPYLTYVPVFAAFEEGEVNITVDLWYRTASEAEPNAKAQQLSKAIGTGGRFLRCDGGCIWLKRGSPWCQNLRDANDPKIKRRHLNVTAEYLTKD